MLCFVHCVEGFLTHFLWCGTTGYPFIVTHHWVRDLLEDQQGNQSEMKGNSVSESLMDEANDYPFHCHSLSQAYGLPEFVVICPAGNEMLTTESRVHLILSSITIAINSIQWSVTVITCHVFFN